MKSVQITTTPWPLNNSSDACISKNVNDVERTIRHDERTIHLNSNFDKITDACIPAIIKMSEINSISKLTILNDLIKECKSFLERVQKFNSNIEKRKHEPDKLNDETKLLETREDGKWKKGTTLIMGDSISEHKMSHRRSLKVRYFPGARIVDMKHYSVPLLMKQPERIILHLGTNAPFLKPGNMFKELKELRVFILKFLPDIKLIFSTPVIEQTNQTQMRTTNDLSIVSKRQSLTVCIIRTSQRII